ncbi:putative ABC transport system permease protein [Streptosporangium subroseum]|uniref:Putative ABC transport system permease protein n=1 Tax=Streptosporangium subroseum TaxID=106412 RepID=A0A239HAT9_9ACTN|nr:FtsX-like permease family protein [Streptosporangium subroseum]SNS78487.1 putative ABC transport system permease protein [Streptosporangium subroseum]
MSALLAALRISRRDAWRAKGRSALIMVMIGLPVLVITGLLTFAATADLTPRERLTADLGTADIRIKTTETRGRLEQDLQGQCCPGGAGPVSTPPWTSAELTKLLGPGARLLPANDGSADFWSRAGRGHVTAHELDLRDPLTAGMYRLVEGRVPASPQEIAVTPAMLERGARLGAPLVVTRAERSLRVVGTVENPHQTNSAEIVGLPGTLLLDRRDGNGVGWLADTARPVRWADVQRLNGVGLLVRSRAVIEDPPAYGPRFEPSSNMDQTVAIGLAGVMIVLEVVLLAGPAFAVGLRRRRRELALITAQGGSPGHLRMIVLADGIVLGGGAAVIGLTLGVGLASLSAALEAGRLIGGVGPLEIPWGLVVITALIGTGSGLIAALVPAVQAARQDMAAVLGGRASAVRDRAGTLLPGLVLLVAGAVAAVFAIRIDQNWVLAAALLAQLGLVALAPRLVRAATRVAARLPLPFRLAARDASRHRGRTASAVAAVMTATAAVIAVGVATSSGYAQSRDAFQAVIPAGTTTIETRGLDDDGWAKLRAATERKLPGVPLIEAAEVRDAKGVTLMLSSRRIDGNGPPFFPGSSGGLPIGDGRLLTLVQGRQDPVASAAFSSGKAVVFDPRLVRNGRLSLSVTARIVVSGGENLRARSEITIPAVVARAADPRYAVAVLPVAAAQNAGLEVKTRALYIDPASYRPTLQQELDLEWELATVAPSNVYVEPGFQEDPAPLMWMLLGAALILVLGGTFVATGLAAADMRPDLTTMAAVGAPSGTRRLVVAGQAGFIAGLGVLIGAPAGAFTGIAAIWPAETRGWTERFMGNRMEDGGILSPLWAPPTIEIPWLFLAAVVIGLPILAALVAGALTRTRAVLTRRLT